MRSFAFFALAFIDVPLRWHLFWNGVPFLSIRIILRVSCLPCTSERKSGCHRYQQRTHNGNCKLLSRAIHRTTNLASFQLGLNGLMNAISVARSTSTIEKHRCSTECAVSVSNQPQQRVNVCPCVQRWNARARPERANRYCVSQANLPRIKNIIKKNRKY